MRAELDDKHRIVIDVDDLLHSLNTNQQRLIVDSLACQDDIIKDVADQIFQGWTDTCSHGGISCTAQADARFGLDYAMRLFATHASELAEKEIKRLEGALRTSEKEVQELRELVYRGTHRM